MNRSLIEKYNVPGPRYTSYPTVPYWDNETYSAKKWIQSAVRSFTEQDPLNGISLYIHLPFCESLCTFCACHKHITINHSVENDYINALIKEWQLYCNVLGTIPLVKELHLGGGTPTFFASQQLQRLLTELLKHQSIEPSLDFSFEGHPNNTNKAHLQTLFDFGFRRVSFGVQDYDPAVQKAINRIQPFKNVEKITQMSREMGYRSVGHDLIFGLPFQKIESVQQTIERTNALRPDRIAFYSYAHVPWIKGNGQRGFADADLPDAPTKRTMYVQGKALLEEKGYKEVGMDHFALKNDGLYIAMTHKALHRNFMGYTHTHTQLMLGLGVSSISDSWYGFSQNVKDINEYYAALQKNELPLLRGHILSEVDLSIRRHVLNLMCQMETDWSDDLLLQALWPSIAESLNEMKIDGLVAYETNGTSLKITEEGKAFVRNVCMVFDQRLMQAQPQTRIFSMTI